MKKYMINQAETVSSYPFQPPIRSIFSASRGQGSKLPKQSNQRFEKPKLESIDTSHLTGK